MTELQQLKTKCYKKDGSKKKGATPADYTRLKVLQDGEPLSKTDLAVAQKREEERKAQDKAAFEARKKIKPGADIPQSRHDPTKPITMEDMQSIPDDLEVPAEHPRIETLKKALLPFTKIEAHDSRPNEFVLFTRDISITAGDVRAARKAMKV